ncbi:MAG: hypothetical protein PVH60_02520 [Anaerolineales bacterium]|jgi:NADH:ubiquinone oxidoreductase subunit 4 (subunit M)
MDQGLIVLLLSVIVFFCILAMFIVIQALFKSWIEESKRHAREAAGRSFSIGFVNALLLTALSFGFWVLGENTAFAVFSILGLLLMTALIIAAVFGLTAMAMLISERVLPETHGWRQLAGGGGMLTLACLTPYVGWFGLLPYVVFRGLGGFIQSLVQAWRERRQSRKKEAQSE